MSRIQNITLLTVFSIAGCALLSAQSQSTSPGAAPANPPLQRSVNPPAGANHILQGTYFSVGNHFSAMAPPATYTPVDNPQTIQCPGSSGTCTIEADMWVETGNTSIGTPNNFALCASVDGVFIENGACYYSADTPNDASFVTGTRSDTRGGYAVGSHTVQTYIYTNNGTPVQQYNVSYRVYKP